MLATQRPEGVVSADIRANTNLRICLAVTRDAESRDVLDSVTAATISRATPGRAYVRTGHGELHALQAARVGGRRPGRLLAAHHVPVVEVVPATELGDPLPRPTGREDDAADATDLALLVEACAGASRQLGLPLPRSPWLDPLPEVLLPDDLPRVADPLAGTPGRVAPLAYALLDVPEEQARHTLAFDLDRSASLLVLGAPRSGRTTTLRALAGAVAATATPDDVHLYALDLGGGGLAALAALPHTGAVVTADQPERVDRLLSWLSDEVSRRQRLLTQGGHTDLLGQRSTCAPEDRLPHLVLLLDRWEAFLASFSDLDAGRLVELLLALVRSGSSVGVQVVVTADRSGIVGRIGSLVEQRLLLRLSDRSDYPGLGLPARLVPEDLPAGRGWSLGGAPLVAQVALLDADPAGPAQGEALRRLAALTNPAVRPPRRFELLPTSVRRSALTSGADRHALLLGVGGDELEPVGLHLSDLSTGLLVAGPPGSGRSTALLTLAAGLLEHGRIVIALAPRPSPLRSLPGYLHGPAPAELEELLAESGAVLLLDDAELLLDSPLAPVLERSVRSARDTGALVLAAGTTDALLAGYRGFAVELRRSPTGVLLSPRSAADGDLFGVRLSRAVGGDVVPGRGLLVIRGRALPVQVACPD